MVSTAGQKEWGAAYKSDSPQLVIWEQKRTPVVGCQGNERLPGHPKLRGLYESYFGSYKSGMALISVV